MFKAPFLRMFSVMICLFMVLACGISSAPAYEVREPESCKLNFAILSDSHIEGNNFNRYKVFERSLQNLKKNKTGHDAVVFLGDNTMNCQNIENMLFHGTVDMLLKNETVLPVMGNHDIGNGNGNYDQLRNRWYDYTNAFFGKKLNTSYYYEVIDGCYFIVLGPESHLVHEMYMTEAQYTWLEGVLAKAAESGRPAFVFCHYPSDYMIDENDDETERLMDMLADYNETNDLFYFCGHTHRPLFLFWSFHNHDGYPETYLPRLTELAGSNDNEIYDGTGVGIEVEVYENEVLIRGRNFYTGEWVEDEDGPDGYCEATYPLKNAFNG